MTTLLSNEKQTVTQAHVNAARDYFLALAEIEETSASRFPRESAAWQFHRDRYVSLSNTAAQLMGEKDANPFIL